MPRANQAMDGQGYINPGLSPPFVKGGTAFQHIALALGDRAFFHQLRRHEDQQFALNGLIGIVLEQIA